MTFDNNSQHATQSKAQRTSDCASTLLVEKKETVGAMLPCNRDRGRLSDIECLGFQKRYRVVCRHLDEGWNIVEQSITKALGCTSVDAFTKHGIWNQHLSKKLLQNIQPSEKYEVAQDRRIADYDCHF